MLILNQLYSIILMQFTQTLKEDLMFLYNSKIEEFHNKFLPNEIIELLLSLYLFLQNYKIIKYFRREMFKK